MVQFSMINLPDDPRQILIIDDNDEWLKSLASLKIKVFNFRGKSKFDVIGFINRRQSDISVVLVNYNILQVNHSNRTDNVGLSVINSLAKHCPQHLNYFTISFLGNTGADFPNIDYIDLLMFFKDIIHAK